MEDLTVRSNIAKETHRKRQDIGISKGFLKNTPISQVAFERTDKQNPQCFKA